MDEEWTNYNKMVFVLTPGLRNYEWLSFFFNFYVFSDFLKLSIYYIHKQIKSDKNYNI